jgi:hypothetical protein
MLLAAWIRKTKVIYCTLIFFLKVYPSSILFTSICCQKVVYSELVDNTPDPSTESKKGFFTSGYFDSQRKLILCLKD